ncbi:hypothetical protein [Pseudoxanthomonas sp. 10H]|uniref:hypothetical protein n=1 Tax=Pseudoxanthomonas sp. 10H TaxID=3242729 RepID=UPI003558E965
MRKPLSIAVLLLCATACQRQPATEPVASIGGSGPTHPVSRYQCGDTQLGVQLLGESAAVTVDGGAPVQLPEQGSTSGKTVFSDGQHTLTIEAGQLAWTPPQGTPVACTGG